jgi:thiosulfate sulfurtransferase
VTIGEAIELLNDPKTIVLDARDSASYRADHIEGAMLLHDGLMESIINKKEHDRPILIYCFRGNTSVDKGQLFCAAGFERVYSLAGGYIAWGKRSKEARAASGQ